VLLSGGVRVKFKVSGAGKLVPDKAELENFRGEGLTTHRPYVANVSITGRQATNTFFGSKFHVIVHVTAKPNPAFGNYDFFLKWTVRYSWDEHNKLTSFNLYDGFNRQCEPQVKCNLD
jgi:hypothetical protein